RSSFSSSEAPCCWKSSCTTTSAPTSLRSLRSASRQALNWPETAERKIFILVTRHLQYLTARHRQRTWKTGQPRLDLLGFKLGGEALRKLLVLRAVRKKHFHPVADAPPILALCIA